MSDVSYNRYIVLKYSIVVPLHNEEENVTDLYARLKQVMESSGESFEMVLVDDGSTDGTFALLREIARAQSLLAERQLYAPKVLSEPAPLALGHATIEDFIDVEMV